MIYATFATLARHATDENTRRRSLSDDHQYTVAFHSNDLGYCRVEVPREALIAPIHTAQQAAGPFWQYDRPNLQELIDRSLLQR